jgi:hypothetical protein
MRDTRCTVDHAQSASMPIVRCFYVTGALTHHQARLRPAVALLYCSIAILPAVAGEGGGGRGGGKERGGGGELGLEI